MFPWLPLLAGLPFPLLSLLAGVLARRKAAGQGTVKARQRGDEVGADYDEPGAMTYDDVMRLVKRFRAKVPGRVEYKGRLLKLLDAVSLKALERRFLTLVQKAERKRGATLDDAVGGPAGTISGWLPQTRRYCT